MDHACAAAEDAFWSYGYSTREERAAFLNTIADEIEARGDQITEIGNRKPAYARRGFRASVVAPRASFASSPSIK